MNRFRIIPVLDLKDGIVVRGISGEREKYLPLKSSLTASAQLPAVVETFINHFDLREFYLADLDAICSGGKKNQFRVIFGDERLRFPDLSLMVDAGVTDVAGAERIISAGVDKVVVGTETLPSLQVLADILETCGPDTVVVSLDTKDLKIISPDPELSQMTPDQLAKEISVLGVRQFILLELLRVGTGSGINRHLIDACLTVLKDTDALIIGGGVSGYEDLAWLAENGVAGALVASVLHNGQVNREMIRTLEGMKSRPN
ncbi:HisA/HisF-related TIM barrel protein [Candidatus Formimonas warabiya]|nr:HisA/HisF-related TIM barrel protein [Candidatus Formimonas warabiya]